STLAEFAKYVKAAGTINPAVNPCKKRMNRRDHASMARKYENSMAPVNNNPINKITNGPLLSVKNPEMTFPIVYEKEYIPPAKPVKKGVAPRDVAKGVIIGS